MNKRYDIAIIGGGVAGLSLAIQLVNAGIRTILFERKAYPFHKVCGEYISMESWNFIVRLGLPLRTMNLPMINKLRISSPSGQVLEHVLKPGGFGLSRYSLDHELAKLAQQKGVELISLCKVKGVREFNEYQVVETDRGNYEASIVAGAWGKHSNLDEKRNRSFLGRNETSYVGVKYHIQTTLPGHIIELHNFKGGYCGISRVEGNKYCLCYITDANSLKKNNGNIKQLEKNVLMKNPYLKHYFEQSEFLFQEPCTTAQIRIGRKRVIGQNILMIGDSAGFTAPLTGNGMSMALRSSALLAALLMDFFQSKINREQLKAKYSSSWKHSFAFRLDFSRFLQRLLVNEKLTNMTIATLKPFPVLVDKMVSATHGKNF